MCPPSLKPVWSPHSNVSKRAPGFWINFWDLGTVWHSNVRLRHSISFPMIDTCKTIHKLISIADLLLAIAEMEYIVCLDTVFFIWAATSARSCQVNVTGFLCLVLRVQLKLNLSWSLCGRILQRPVMHERKRETDFKCRT